ncbi:CBO0543 family protein [Cohnella hashimotonis]|uniref:CBO0543 family protein n=1 Tax=Cohnella hashimotonis TaxID=2826895 RepID=A0ABT6TSJ5_9BACL|nr:CBO0543 family protein [Cohnella hashimotonis]MDI4649828.1 CBO0543 family protein [Cohnella hashimotonis]
MSEKSLLGEIEDVHRKLTELRQDYWLHYDLFSPQWWLMLAALILPWIVWWRLVDKSRLKDILLFGVSIGYLIFLLDHFGYELNLWIYPHKLFRFIPELSAVDFGMLPVLHMLVYQYFPKWRSFLIAETIMGAVFAFVLEPISVWIGVYEMLHWQHFYSFPIYVAKSALVKGVLEGLGRIQFRSSASARSTANYRANRE